MRALNDIGTSVAAVVLAVAFGAGRAEAGSITVQLDTSPLVRHAAGPFSLDFQLDDGTGTGDANNTATLSGFDFGGGFALGRTTSGGASGDPLAGISIVDSAFVSEYTQVFTPGSLLRFTLDYTANVDAGGTPDLFSFAIFDSGGFPIPTADGSGFDTFITLNLDSASPLAMLFPSDPSRDPVSSPGSPIGAMSMQDVSPNPVPEPGLLAIAAVGAVPAAAARRRRARS